MDWERQADWMLDADRVEVVGDRREGVGVRLRVRTRILGLPAFTEPMEVVGWDPPRRLVLRHGAIVRGEGTWSLDPERDGTRFVWVEDVRLGVPVVGELTARIYAPILRRLMARAASGLRHRVIEAGPSGR
jgi:hypothetical protein